MSGWDARSYDRISVPYLRPATGLPDNELSKLAAAVAERLGEQVDRYVRLNATARRG